MRFIYGKIDKQIILNIFLGSLLQQIIVEKFPCIIIKFFLFCNKLNNWNLLLVSPQPTPQPTLAALTRHNMQQNLNIFMGL